MQNHKVVSREEWIAARKEHLAREKELTRMRDRLSAQRRELPWVKVAKEYAFNGDNGKETLADLFAGRSQLLVYHFMFHPDWEAGCKSCSFWADNYNGAVVHLAHRDVTLVAVSRAPLAKLQGFKERMGWSFKWLSSADTDFNKDYHVSFTSEEIAEGNAYYNYATGKFPVEEAPGISIFYRNDAGEIFHTYSCYSRGLDMLNGTYHLLDLVPKGRDEAELPYTMAWLHLHDEYGKAG